MRRCSRWTWNRRHCSKSPLATTARGSGSASPPGGSISPRPGRGGRNSRNPRNGSRRGEGRTRCVPAVFPRHERGMGPSACREGCRCGRCPEPDLNRYAREGQRGLSSPCLHSTIRAGHGAALRIRAYRGASLELWASEPMLSILLTSEGASAPGTGHPHLPIGFRAAQTAYGMTEFHRPNGRTHRSRTRTALGRRSGSTQGAP